jgi:hypothetical protein
MYVVVRPNPDRHPNRYKWLLSSLVFLRITPFDN